VRRPTSDNRRKPTSQGQPSTSAIEEPALQQGEHFFACERTSVRHAAVLLEDADVVLERFVRPIERVPELVALEDHVLRLRVVRLAELGVHGPTDRPHGTCPTLDPDRDLLLLAAIVDSDQQPFGVPPLTGASLHARDTIASGGGIQEPLLVPLPARFE